MYASWPISYIKLHGNIEQWDIFTPKTGRAALDAIQVLSMLLNGSRDQKVNTETTQETFNQN